MGTNSSSPRFTDKLPPSQRRVPSPSSTNSTWKSGLGQGMAAPSAVTSSM